MGWEAAVVEETSELLQKVFLSLEARKRAVNQGDRDQREF